MQLFKKRQKEEKFFVEIYFNLNKGSYSEAEKRILIAKANDLAQTLFSSVKKWKYDIQGHGYGISKGSGYFGIRAFNSKFEKVGFSNCTGITIISNDSGIEIGLYVTPPIRVVSFLKLYLAFPHRNFNEYELSIKFIQGLAEVSTLFYGYGYYCPTKMNNITQTLPKYGLFSVTYDFDQKHVNWENNLTLIHDGIIKDLNVFNLLNNTQIEKLPDIIPSEKVRINECLQVVIYSKEEVLRQRNKGLNNSFEKINVTLGKK